MIRELVEISRSFRRFDENHMISEDILRDLVGAARLTPSARNLQPLRYILSREPGKNTGIFDT
ncbi:MAG: nitroreductase family protein, partial [Bacteroidia bacterium]|nr:nitroreductase family protein [Bacteroidia bacterium]